MLIPLSWLQTWTLLPEDARLWGEHLHAIGFEIEEIFERTWQCSGVVVGEIVTCRPHPHADRLQWLQVSASKTGDELHTVVCGAQNCQVGMKVAYARVGSKLPGFDQPLAAAEIRGIRSEGMLCSAEELGLPTPWSPSKKAILALPEMCEAGDSLEQWVTLHEKILDLTLPSNRPDLQSIRGVAREIEALNREGLGGALSALTKEPLAQACIAKGASLPMAVTISDEEALLCYHLIEWNNLEPPKAVPPQWLQRWDASGIKCQHPWVTQLNALTFELGQPFHAFDADAIEGNMEVRRARPGERIVLLNGKELIFEADFLPMIVADEQGPLSLAGIMGGLRGSIQQNTRHLYLESACFDPQLIAATMDHFDLQTQAGHLFERGTVNPAQSLADLLHAVQHIFELQGVTSPEPFQLPRFDFVSTTQLLFPARTLPLRERRIQALLGINPSSDRNFWEKLTTALGKLGIQIQKVASDEVGLKTFQCSLPSWRKDLKYEEDLIEVVARFWGLDRIPTSPMALPVWPISGSDESSESAVWEAEAHWRRYLAHQGFFEVRNFSFISDDFQASLISLSEETLRIERPLTQQLNALRQSCIPSLLQNAQFNQSRHGHRLPLFEIGATFWRDALGVMHEEREIALLLSPGLPLHWRQSSASEGSESDLYFELKEVCEKLWIEIWGASTVQTFHFNGPVNDPWASPTQSTKVSCDGVMKGSLGMLHPQWLKALHLKQPLALAAFKIKKLHTPELGAFEFNHSVLPVARKHWSCHLPSDTQVGVWLQALRHALPAEALQRWHLQFYLSDVYRSDQDARLQGQKRVTLVFEIQGKENNVSDEEIELFLNDLTKTLEIQGLVEKKRVQ